MIYRIETIKKSVTLELDSVDFERLLIVTNNNYDISLQLSDENLFEFIGVLLKIQGKRNHNKENNI